MVYLSKFLLLMVATLSLIALQYQYWQGEYGVSSSQQLEQQIKQQQQLNAQQMANNRVLQADIKDLKSGLEAVEEHARLDLGLIKPNETFVQLSTAAVPQRAN